MLELGEEEEREITDISTIQPSRRTQETNIKSLKPYSDYPVPGLFGRRAEIHSEEERTRGSLTFASLREYLLNAF